MAAKHGSCLGFSAAGPPFVNHPVHRSLSQQVVGQFVSRGCQIGSRVVCRALVLSAALILLASAGGCGEVHFVPSPYTPQDVGLIYSSQEPITVVRWRVS